MENLIPTIWIRSLAVNTSVIVENNKADVEFTNNTFLCPGHKDTMIAAAKSTRSMIALQYLVERELMVSKFYGPPRNISLYLEEERFYLVTRSK